MNVTSNRISTQPSENGKATRRKPKRKTSTKRKTKKNPDHIRKWAIAGVIVMSVLSALLNGYANSLHAEIVWAGWGMGLVVPAIVLIIGKVAGLLWKRNQKYGAPAMGAVGAGLLFLSVWHCATSISLLTGSPFMLAFPMAIAIDCGLVGCEVTATVIDD